LTGEFEFAITFNTDEHFDLEQVISTLQNVEALLTDLERNIRPDKSPEAKWAWADAPSFRVVASVNGIDADDLSRIVTVAREGFARAGQATVEGARFVWPEEYGAEARRSAENILRLLSQLESITIEATGSEPIELQEALVGTLLRGKRANRVYGSVDGTLELISHRRSGNTLIAGLREQGTGNYVRCSMSAERWRDEIRARSLWDKPVRVYGRVAYGDEGQAVSIVDVDTLEERHSRVDLRSLRGALPNLTGGEDVEGFLERLRPDG
jgi:hypothetical protein